MNKNEELKNNVDSPETNPKIKEMDEALKKIVELPGSPESSNGTKYKVEGNQTRLERVRNLRRQIMGMDLRELDVFKEKYLPNLKEEMRNAMEFDAVNDAVKKRSVFFTNVDRRENKDSGELLSDAEKDLLIENAKDIFDKVKPPEGIDRIAFAREVLAHEPEIQASRSEAEKLFKEIVGKEATESVITKLRSIIDESALAKEPDAVLKYVKNLLAECGTTFESLEEGQQEKLRNAIVDISAYAIDFTSLKPDVRRIKQIETGGNVDDFGRSKKAGVENPFLDFPEGKEGEEKKRALQRNFDQIGGVTLRKIVERVNGIVEEAGALENVNDKQKKTIEKQIESICKQLGQERWWRARYLTQEQVDKYKDGLFKLPDKIVNEIKDKMVTEDVGLKTPFHRAIYNRLFGNYDEDYGKIANQAEKLQAAA